MCHFCLYYTSCQDVLQLDGFSDKMTPLMQMDRDEGIGMMRGDMGGLYQWITNEVRLYESLKTAI